MNHARSLPTSLSHHLNSDSTSNFENTIKEVGKLKRLSFTVILLLLLVSVIGVVNTGEVKAKDPPVFNTNEIRKDPHKS